MNANAIELIDNLVASYKKQDAKYPEAVALGALKVKFYSFLWYVEDLLDAIKDDPRPFVKHCANGVRDFINRLEEEAEA